ncbi:bifunctional hydroxymethylpyrimidine kinase/phosphomethylpyrimidine kinase [Terribacillus saccharophilus]|uniref:Hydroxymethylpyrimidine/phosphomethylpyrimidine kinase n=1 Tax=Terribacillus saccharophilus TaxID=361277 RepID=A0A268A842_9BACI|nr:bifunctional hydroxymethylpyrimidine kinase/phosphomethylpyrimidine kinase [Terribacillus saccharophilus]PAD20287.1 bifunctional hydroxymethylpyrimidine kinase/phosphomethylpyrimidine kinase [Terribacillus saccharophilus]PAF20774.1 bifunctional hydroxymethylpyrimidine kinase/phosphomethylpyrimidine kinase [Terribacillus saccharophilus]PAF35835.1 bifunctional hydroxymethylpyrimidine kinase/phosphomethylpyrimidine kinase [Terribacillus saccharophilus]PAF39963.1 bifunctional hydroxymethylpyrimi
MLDIKSALTIAGTDPSGGAGIQADLKTFQEREVYGMSVVTSLVAQNTIGVQAVHHVPVEFLEQQLESIFSDITPAAVKTGMIASEEMMHCVAAALRNSKAIYVMDPVMYAKSGHALMGEDSRDALKTHLVPLAALITPNIPEAEELTGIHIEDENSMKAAAKIIVREYGAKAVLMKGGHMEGAAAADLLYDGSSFSAYSAERIQTKHTHGTGCTYSAAITAELAKGKSLQEAVRIGKDFVTDAIQYSLQIGKGNGPTNHWGYRLQGVPVQEEQHNEVY